MNNMHFNVLICTLRMLTCNQTLRLSLKMTCRTKKRKVYC